MKNKTCRVYTIIMLVGIFTIINSCGQIKKKNQGMDNGKNPAIEDLFNRLDTNTDSLLSKDEVRGPLKRDFNKLDMDKDGFISKEELKNAPKPERHEPRDSR